MTLVFCLWPCVVEWWFWFIDFFLQHWSLIFAITPLQIVGHPVTGQQAAAQVQPVLQRRLPSCWNQFGHDTRCRLLLQSAMQPDFSGNDHYAVSSQTGECCTPRLLMDKTNFCVFLFVTLVCEFTEGDFTSLTMLFVFVASGHCAADRRFGNGLHQICSFLKRKRTAQSGKTTSSIAETGSFVEHTLLQHRLALLFQVFSEKMGLEAGWNCHISLLSDSENKSENVTAVAAADSEDAEKQRRYSLQQPAGKVIKRHTEVTPTNRGRRRSAPSALSVEGSQVCPHRAFRLASWRKVTCRARTYVRVCDLKKFTGSLRCDALPPTPMTTCYDQLLSPYQGPGIPSHIYTSSQFETLKHRQ